MLVEVQVPVEPMETVETEVAPGLVEPAVAAARQRRLVAVRPVVQAEQAELQAFLARGELPAWELDQQESGAALELRLVAAREVAAALPTAPARELSLQPAELVGPEDLVHQAAQVAPAVTPK